MPERVTVSVPIPAEPTVNRAIDPIATPSPSGFHLERFLPGLVMAWIAGVLAMALRGGWGWLTIRRWRRHAEPIGNGWPERLRCLQQKLHLSRPVLLLRSLLVDSPVALGCLRAVILLPASCLSGLTPAQLEAVLLHELAHIRRYDYWVNLLQMLVETVLFYRPAVWWVSNRMRQEREHCCDDWVVALSGDRAGYVRALALLEALRGSRAQLALAARGGPLLLRARRLLLPPPPARPLGGFLVGIVSLLFMAGALVGVRFVVHAGQGASPDQTAGSSASRVGGAAKLKRGVYQLDWIAFEHAMTNRFASQGEQPMPRALVGRFLDSLGISLAPPNEARFSDRSGLLWLALEARDMERLAQSFDKLSRAEGVPVAQKRAEWAPITTLSEPLQTLTYRVDPNTFLQNLEELEPVQPGSHDGARLRPPPFYGRSVAEALAEMIGPVLSIAGLDLPARLWKPNVTGAFDSEGAGIPPPTSAPVEPNAASGEHKILPFEMLRIIVAGETNLSGDFRVQKTGKISYPYLGDLVVTNRTPVELERHIADQLRDKQYLVHPHVQVTVREALSRSTKPKSAGVSNGGFAPPFGFDPGPPKVTLAPFTGEDGWSPGYKVALVPVRAPRAETAGDGYSKRMAELNGVITNLQSKIEAAKEQLKTSGEDREEREAIAAELQRLLTGKAELERQARDVAFLHEQARKVTDGSVLRPARSLQKQVVFDSQTGIITCQATSDELVLRQLSQLPGVEIKALPGPGDGGISERISATHSHSGARRRGSRGTAKASSWPNRRHHSFRSARRPFNGADRHWGWLAVPWLSSAAGQGFAVHSQSRSRRHADVRSG